MWGLWRGGRRWRGWGWRGGRGGRECVGAAAQTHRALLPTDAGVVGTPGVPKQQSLILGQEVVQIALIPVGQRRSRPWVVLFNPEPPQAAWRLAAGLAALSPCQVYALVLATVNGLEASPGFDAAKDVIHVHLAAAVCNSGHRWRRHHSARLLHAAAGHPTIWQRCPPNRRCRCFPCSRRPRALQPVTQLQHVHQWMLQRRRRANHR